MTKRQAEKLLDKLGACPSGVAWFRAQRNPKEAWEKCRNGERLWWLVWKLGIVKSITQLTINLDQQYLTGAITLDTHRRRLADMVRKNFPFEQVEMAAKRELA